MPIYLVNSGDEEMRYIATGQEVFRIDEFTTNVIGIPQLVLMERAALRIAEHVKERFPAGAHVLIVVESGNNGGDGIAAGRILMMEGYDVEIYWVDGLKSASTGFDAQYAIAKKLNMKFVDELVNAGYDVIIDGIFGVGLSRAVMGRQAEVIKALNDMDGYKLAIDVPSGIDATTGFLLGTAFHADATVTFGLMKLGLLMGMGYEYAGEVSVVDIGFPKQAIDFVEPRLYTYDPKDVEAYGRLPGRNHGQGKRQGPHPAYAARLAAPPRLPLRSRRRRLKHPHQLEAHAHLSGLVRLRLPARQQAHPHPRAGRAGQVPEPAQGGDVGKPC